MFFWAARNAGVVRDNLEEIWAPTFAESKEDRFNRYIQNWLLDKPWKAEDDMEDFTLIWIDLPTNCILDYSSTGDKVSALIEYANS